MSSCLQPKEITQWEMVCHQLKDILGADTFSSWFSSVSFEEEKDNVLYLSVPTRFLKQWLDFHYSDILLKTWRFYCPHIKKIVFVLRTLHSAPPAPSFLDKTLQNKTNKLPEIKIPPKEKKKDKKDFQGVALNSKYTFTSFVKDQSNALAVAAANQILHTQDVSFNPLYIHAEVGLGKTHLMQAIGREACSKGLRIFYLTAEYFMYGFISALSGQSTLSFKEQFQNIDLLLIDDIQFLQGKRVQQEFAYILNMLIDAKKQVIIASDRLPSHQTILDERTRSRLDGGLTVHIDAMECTLRRSILQMKAQSIHKQYKSFFIADDVADFIARNMRSNGRELEGALNRLAAHSQLTNTPIDIEMTQIVLRDLMHVAPQETLTVEMIQKKICQHYDISLSDLLSKRRTQKILHPRQVAIYLAKTLTPASLSEIGRLFGNRDHTTILHTLKRVEKKMHTDLTFSQEIKKINQIVERR